MNLEKASNNHRNIVISIACLFVFAKIAGIAPGKENSAIVSAIAFAFFAWHGISIFLLGKNLNKNKIIWAAIGIISPVLLFIPSAIAIVSANKIFKANNWKVNFYGGASNQSSGDETNDIKTAKYTHESLNTDKNYVKDLDKEMEEARVDNLHDLEEYREKQKMRQSP